MLGGQVLKRSKVLKTHGVVVLSSLRAARSVKTENAGMNVHRLGMNVHRIGMNVHRLGISFCITRTYC